MELTPEKEKAIAKLMAKSFAKSFFTGMHHALMLILINFIAFMGSQIFFEGDQTLTMVLSIGVSIYVLHRMSSIINEDAKKLKEAIDKIIKSE